MIRTLLLLLSVTVSFTLAPDTTFAQATGVLTGSVLDEQDVRRNGTLAAHQAW